MTHIANVGPALHVHDRVPGSFVVLEDNYIFFKNDVPTKLTSGEAISIATNIPHRNVSGGRGGKLLVISPPGLENYFWDVSQQLSHRELSLKDEADIAESHGQRFLDLSLTLGAHINRREHLKHLTSEPLYKLHNATTVKTSIYNWLRRRRFRHNEHHLLSFCQ